ncbi:hypothetical protein CMV_026163 [Castanea mollissima]|uniref:Uncharacterized protein n=1 Tax=Castanea mollissima TaxID=60419 RepID=A0A8J4QML2_9ROSI|nr:hypothetical protein CMV_026163 [Castanea mollissima]
MFITTDGALSFCICVCYDDYRYICISFQVHIQQWIDFASFEIDANILAFYGPKIGRAVYLPLTGSCSFIIEERAGCCKHSA